jgi:ribosomal protein S6--L-glutamate ligase
MLGGGQGWHADQLRQACRRRGCEFERADYESLAAKVDSAGVSRGNVTCSAGDVRSFDVILTRTMPAASLDRITFRLATLHHLHRAGQRIVNSAASLEIAIDKYATLSVVAGLEYPVPETRVVQSRRDAMEAFRELGGDCVVKPIFGGEGRGVMRVSSIDLALTTFATLDQLDAAIYLQRFIPPGGCDTRLLKIGHTVIGLRRTNSTDFRTNLSHGGRACLVDVEPWQSDLANRVCESIGLGYGSVDLIDDEDHGYRVVEVNAIPGWQGAQSVCDRANQPAIADQIVDLLIQPTPASVD